MNPCPTRKIQYGSRAEARSQMKRGKKQGGESGSRPYRCPECQMWHLGRKLPRHAQRSRRRYMDGQFPDERRLDGA